LSEEFPAQLAGFRAGALVAGYRLEAQVGAGGMAVVFRARDERLGRLVALKILAPAMAADAAFRRRFIAESRAAAVVDDPHIIPVYEAGEAGGVLFIAMRFVRGGDLRLVLDREGPLPPVQAVGFISPVASALDAAHGAGLVHRDVKPANILVDARQGRPDHVYLSDFGVSKGAISSVSLTEAGQFLGTPDYSAPEQIRGLAIDGRTDQYALACVAYQLLTGVVPFERDQGMAVLLAHLSEPSPSLASRRPDLPGAADQVLAKGLAKDPEKRYGSCGAFADALRQALGAAPYSSRSVASASDNSETEMSSSAGIPASGGIREAAVPTDLAAAATIDSEPGRLAGEAISAAVSPAGASGQQTGRLGIGGTPGSLTGGPSLTGELSKPTADGPASAANFGDARPNAGDVDLTGAVAGSIGVIDSAANRRRGSISSPLSRLVRPVPLAAASEKSTATRSGPSHRARAERNTRIRRRWPIVTTVLAVLLALVIAGSYIFYRVSQEQYYVAADGSGQVVIYRGISQHIAGFSWSSPYETTGIELSQVPSNYQQAVKTAYSTGSLTQVRSTVTNIRAAVDDCRSAYAALQNWATAVNSYNAQVVQAHNQRKPTNNIPKPPAQPPGAGAMCPSAAAFGIPASALAPTGPGSS
jgi:serine/threonine protein kinase